MASEYQSTVKPVAGFAETVKYKVVALNTGVINLLIPVNVWSLIDIGRNG